MSIETVVNAKRTRRKLVPKAVSESKDTFREVLISLTSDFQKAVACTQTPIRLSLNVGTITREGGHSKGANVL
ncbi:hypothetical protein PISMIDRAFT_688532 [Pisolithus microcarpus 441]|uniref:Uncharacterized protein n=1 Tax=Pisolithus microcarpus 441 TaxID=765257 RepID=A0A0C9XMM0_9AGAM|nr:hypothetical protein PISMIDRAFT_688532 [Pisolithus microcarpus 441]